MKVPKHITAREVHPNFIPTIGSQFVPLSPAASHTRERVTAGCSEIGTRQDSPGRSESLVTSLIMLRSQVRFLLAPPVPSAQRAFRAQRAEVCLSCPNSHPNNRA
jgi:hypothetical protein